MDFIIDNYLWIIIVGVILLMAFIGYIAEKEGYGKKEKKKKDEISSSKIDGDDDFKKETLDEYEEDDIPLEKSETVVPTIEETKDEIPESVSKILNESDDFTKEELTLEPNNDIVFEERKEEPEEIDPSLFEDAESYHQPLNIDKDFNTLLEDDDIQLPEQKKDDDLEEIDEDMWKF